MLCPANAANYHFDADGNTSAAVGGSGTWDVGLSLWRTPLATDPLTTWAEPGHTAVFGGTVGPAFTVTIKDNTTIAANGITFSIAGYTIAAGNNAALNMTSASITATGAGTIEAPILGTTNLTKTGTQLLTLSGANRYTGLTSIGAGAVSVATVGDWAVGNTQASNLGSPISLTSGGIFLGSGGVSGTLIYTGTGETTNRYLQLNGNQSHVGTIQNDGTGALVFTGNFTSVNTAAANVKYFGFAGTNTDNNEVQGTITNFDSDTLTGIMKSQTGTWILSGANTNTGALSIAGGKLIGTQTSGTPFGGGVVSLVGGTLALSPSGSGVNVNVTGGAASSGNVFTYGGQGGTVQLTRGANTGLTYTVGGGGTAAIARTGTGTLVVSITDIADLGGAEKFIINGAAPTTTNGIVNPSIVGQGRAQNNAGDFLTHGVNGFVVATYSGSTDINGGTAFTDTRVFNATGATTNTLNGDTAVYALKNSGQDIGEVGGSRTLSIGANAGQAGLVMNGGTISTSALSFGAAEGVIYTGGAGGTISASLNSNSAITVFGPGVLTLAGTASTRTNLATATVINGGTLRVAHANGLYNTNAGTTSGVITVNTGGTLELANVDWGAGGTRIPFVTLAENGATFKATGTSVYSKGSGFTVTLGKNVGIDTGTSASDTLTFNSAMIGGGGGTLVVLNPTGSGTINLASSQASFITNWEVRGGKVLAGGGSNNNPFGTAFTIATPSGIVRIKGGVVGLANDFTGTYSYVLDGGTLSGAGGGTRVIASGSRMALASNSTIDLKNAATGATANQNLSYAGAIGGSGRLTVNATGTGTGTLSLTGASTYAGGTTIGDNVTVAVSGGALGTGEVLVKDGGTLDLGSSQVIADNAPLKLETGGLIILNTGVNETVGGLRFNGITQVLGTWGSSDSSATYQNDGFFSGTGVLTVVPEPGMLSVLGIGAFGLLSRRRRRDLAPS